MSDTADYRIWQRSGQPSSAWLRSNACMSRVAYLPSGCEPGIRRGEDFVCTVPTGHPSPANAPPQAVSGTTPGSIATTEGCAPGRARRPLESRRALAVRCSGRRLGSPWLVSEALWRARWTAIGIVAGPWRRWFSLSTTPAAIRTFLMCATGHMGLRCVALGPLRMALGGPMVGYGGRWVRLGWPGDRRGWRWVH